MTPNQSLRQLFGRRDYFYTQVDVVRHNSTLAADIMVLLKERHISFGGIVKLEVIQCLRKES